LLPDAGELERRYAAFLGLDGGPPAAEVAAAPPAPRPARRGLWVPLAAVLAPVVVIAVLFVLREVNPGADDGESARPAEPGRGISSAVSIPETSVSPRPQEPAASAPRRRSVKLVLTADGGASWVEAHSGSATGPLLFEGTLESGRELRLEARRIWLRLGAASNLSFAVNGRPAPGELHGTVDVVVTSRGIESA
jgi:cytoskeleton protein RodZ